MINLDSYELLVDGRRVDTPPQGLELLYHLASSPNQVFTRNQLPGRGVGLRLLRRFPHRGCAHQAPAGKAGGRLGQWSLKTVWGVGYKFEVIRPQ